MDIELFNFPLPERLIAQHPSDRRDHSRLLVLNKATGRAEHQIFSDILGFLKPGDVLVRNDTRVIPARLYGVKLETNAHVEVLLLKEIHPDVYECLVGNAKTVKTGTRISFGNGLLIGTCLDLLEEGVRVIQFAYEGVFLEILEKIGQVPLPPYIHEPLADKDRYQTVYARVNGSAAGPTAGFHFTPDLLKAAKEKGVIVVDLTLHIGLATFRPVKVKDTSDHKMHFEQYQIDEAAAVCLNEAKRDHRRIIAVGTTSTRALEANFAKYGRFTACQESTDIFICPGYRFQAVDAIVTNFHLPKSTLIMMISAFAGRETILKTYAEAIEKEYRFFSFGDAMFIYGT
ncbi:MAG: tRNA preQ1(34) S-adenosylmethionine ribosyltransferase-isomerase QueA [Bacilli bacterium]|jgi:S-adenosylmethionine:tRNA ribosyltransferase-isomerase